MVAVVAGGTGAGCHAHACQPGWQAPPLLPTKRPFRAAPQNCGDCSDNYERCNSCLPGFVPDDTGADCKPCAVPNW